MKERLIPAPHLRLAILALTLASGICVAMILARAVFLGRMEFSGVCLGISFWLDSPLVLALRIHTLSARVTRHFRQLAACGTAWFFFFQNAPYIVTDLVHWKNRAPVPKWFDLLMIMSFAWTGLFLGYLSLYLMQELVRRWKGRNWSWHFVIAMLALSSFAIYLGRFQRWNSWDIIARPLGLMNDVVRSADFAHSPESLVFSATFFAFSLLSYLTLFALTHLHGWTEPRTMEAEAPRITRAIASSGQIAARHHRFSPMNTFRNLLIFAHALLFFAGGSILAGDISTFAGVGTKGFSGDGGPASKAQINDPFGLTREPDGYLYFCDTGQPSTRPAKSRLKGQSRLWWQGLALAAIRGDGGPAAQAALNEPYEVRFDAAGSLFFVERLNAVVRRVDAKSGIISTLAGPGQPGFRRRRRTRA